MPRTDELGISELLSRHEAGILQDWVRLQLAHTGRSHLLKDSDLDQDSRTFLSLLRAAVDTGQITDVAAREWDEVRRMLEELSRNRATLGFSPSQTAMFWPNRW